MKKDATTNIRNEESNQKSLRFFLLIPGAGIADADNDRGYFPDAYGTLQDR